MFERKKSAGKIHALPIDAIRPSPFQARTSFDEQELAGLAQSIRENGLLQPINFYEPKGRGSEAYMDLAIEFVKNNRPHDAAPKRRRKAAEGQEPPKNALEEV